MNPKVSVIIPIYNVEKYLEKCLNCLLNQSLKEIEIICINDGSKDNSYNLLTDFAQKDARIIILSQDNQGPGVARNNGLAIAKGEYIGFVDPDDYIDSDFLERLYNCAIINNSDIVKGNVKFETDSGFEYSQENLKIKYENKKVPLKSFRADWWSAIYKKSNIDKYNISFAEAYYLEDVAFLDKNLLIAKSFTLLDDVFYHHCIRQNSLTTMTKDEEFCFKQFYISYLNILNFVKSHNINKYYMNETFYKHMIWFFMNIYEATIRDNVNYLSNCKYIIQLLQQLDLNIFSKKRQANLNYIINHQYERLYKHLKNKFKFVKKEFKKNKLYLMINLYFLRIKICVKKGYYE